MKFYKSFFVPAVFFLFLFFFSSISYSQNLSAEDIQPSHDRLCLVRSALKFKVPPALLIGIYQADPGEPGKVYKQENGNEQLGLMKVDAKEVSQLSVLWNLDNKLTYERLRDDGCINAEFVAKKLQTFMTEENSMGSALGKYGAYLGKDPEKYSSKIHSLLIADGLITDSKEKNPNPDDLPRWFLLKYAGGMVIQTPGIFPNMEACLKEAKNEYSYNFDVRVQCLDFDSGALYQDGHLIRKEWIAGIPKNMQLGKIAPWVRY